MRRRLLLFSIVLASACLDEDLTLGEACVADDECLGDQICGRTPQELSLNLPGLCVEEGGACDFGNQIGCVCDSNGTAAFDDDYCTAAPPRYQTNAQVFIKCDLEMGSQTYDQCILDDGMGN
jgi:hypothetical protein